MEHKYILRVQNVNSCLITNDESFKQKLARAMRARPVGFQHSVAYKKKRWDGWTYFFKEKTGIFPTGLCHEVKVALKKFGYPYQIIDETQTARWTNFQIGDQFINRWLPPDFDPVTLHDFQPDLANQCFKYNRGIVQAPTGAGKTFIMISLLHSLPPKTPTLFLTKNAGLVHQNWEEMQRWGIQNVGRYYDKYKEKNWIICATTNAQTLENINWFLPKVKVLIVDEVHDCVCESPVAAYRKMVDAGIRIGFSATPFRSHKKKIDMEHKLLVKGNFGPIFKTSKTKTGLLTTKELQERGILSPSNCTFYPINHPDLAYETYADAVKLGLEQNFHFHQIVKRLEQTLKGRTLIIVERVEQGKYLKQLMPHAHWIYGNVKVEDRLPTLASLRDDEKCTCIAMRHIITAGINVYIHNLINAAGGDAAHNLIQQMGRGLRTKDDKELLQYYDFLYLMNDYLRKHSEWRMEVLENEGHKVTLKEELDF